MTHRLLNLTVGLPFAYAGVARATPSPTAIVSGTVEQGELVAVGGAECGCKGGSEPQVSYDFENGPIGSEDITRWRI